MFFAAGLLADAVENMQQLGWLNFLANPLWHTGGLLSEGSTLGDIAHSFVGYADSPTPLQVLAYAAYLATVLFFFLRVGHRAKSPAPAPVTQPCSRIRLRSSPPYRPRLPTGFLTGSDRAPVEGPSKGLLLALRTALLALGPRPGGGPVRQSA